MTAETPEHHYNRMWAMLSLAAFLIVYLSCLVLDVRGLMPFAYAGITMISILIIEGLLRGQMWLFDAQSNKIITRPDMPFRLLIFVGSFLLILETLVILGVAFSPRFEQALGTFLLKQACSQESSTCL